MIVRYGEHVLQICTHRYAVGITLDWRFAWWPRFRSTGAMRAIDFGFVAIGISERPRVARFANSASSHHISPERPALRG
jgi:hypothetical protein